MSTSTGTTSSASVYTTPAFWERLWRTAGIQSVCCFIVAYIVYGHQPQVGASADTLTVFYDGDRMRILIAVVFYGLAVLNLMWFAGALRTTLADAGQDGCDRLQRCPRSVFPLAHRGGRSPGVLHCRLGKSPAYIGPERLRMGKVRVDFVPARDADHGLGVRAVAGPADLERDVRGRGRCRRARLAGRHHLADRRILGTGRSLFAFRLACHRRVVGHGREQGALDPRSCYSQWVVSQRGRTRWQSVIH
jgi:hypothetical protein